MSDTPQRQTFAIVPPEVFADDRLSKTDLRVLGAILLYRNRETNLCWPTRDQISQVTGLAPCKISTATTRLVNLGWLVKRGNGGRSRAVRYEFTVPDLTDEKGYQSSNGLEQKNGYQSGNGYRTSNGYRSGNETVTDSVTKTVTDSVTGIEQTINRPEQTKREGAQTRDARATRTGTRLPDDWTLPDDWAQWAVENGLPAKRLQGTADRFRDYWISVPGAKGRKRDWLATWRNWVRRECETLQRQPSARPDKNHPVHRLLQMAGGYTPTTEGTP